MEQQDKTRYFVTCWFAKPKNNLEKQLHALGEKYNHHLLERAQIESVVQEAKQIVSEYKGSAKHPSIYWKDGFDIVHIILCDSLCVYLTPVIED